MINYFVNCPKSKELGTTTKSLNFVFKAESSSFSFFKFNAAINFCGKMAPNKSPLLFSKGIIFAPFSNIYFASCTVKSS